MFQKDSFKGLQGEWELEPEAIASVFKHKGWGHDNGKGKIVVPQAAEIEDVVGTLVKELMETDDNIGKMRQRGRLMVYRDPEAKGSYDVFLNLGFVWDEALTEEEREELGIEDE